MKRKPEKIQAITDQLPSSLLAKLVSIGRVGNRRGKPEFFQASLSQLHILSCIFNFNSDDQL